MNFIEKYEQLILQIEEAVKAQDDEITEKLSKVYGTNTRHLAEAFNFISGITLSQYIKQRRLVNALHYKYENACSLESAAIKYGFPDAATMSKAFKACFGKSPSQISEAELCTITPLTLEELSISSTESINSVDADTISAEDKIEFEHLAYTYELSKNEALFAYELSVNRNISLEKAFELVKEFSEQECFPIDDSEFYELLKQLREHINIEKVFIENPFRMAEVERAMSILGELFPKKEKFLKDDPLQMGAVILCVDSFDMCIRGEYELALFAELCSLVDNFEIYPTSCDSMHFAAVMQGAYKRIG